ncbi:hypothetical protein AX16_010808 [Volvariella volvacea WC 439]|nr:hypothetical protein AX16_010808 [Volvariella volvacea WC 439]
MGLRFCTATRSLKRQQRVKRGPSSNSSAIRIPMPMRRSAVFSIVYMIANVFAFFQFIAEDSTGAVDAAGMDNYSYVGQWVSLVLGSSFAAVEKESRDGTITLASLSVDGNLYFKDIAKLQFGKFANYNNDRIVTYENDYSGRDFIAYVCSLESSPETLGIAGATQTFTGVSWTNE